MNPLTEMTARGRVREGLKQAILSGRLLPGEKLVATTAISNRYGVAPKTAHEALRELVDEGLVVRERGRGTFVAEQVAPGTPRTVAIMMPAAGHVWPEMLSQIVRGLQSRGCRAEMIDVTDGDRTAGAKTLAARLHERPPAGAICRHLETARLVQERYPGCRAICAMGVEDYTFTGDIASPDVFAAAYLGTRHLLAGGRRRIGLCSAGDPRPPAPGGMSELDFAIAGFRHALAEAGLEPGPEINASLVEGAGGSIKEVLTGGPLPDGFYCTSDFRGVQVIDTVRDLGARVPDDVAVVGAHNTPWSHAYRMTTMETHWDRVAGACVQLLADAWGEQLPSHRRVRVHPEIIIRGTCGAKPQSQRRN